MTEHTTVKTINRVGKFIKEYREANDMTQLDLAKHPKLNYKYPNFIEC